MDLFELAAQGASDGLWDWDLITNRIHFSNKWNAMLGNDGSTLENTPEEWFRRVHPEDLDQVQSEIQSHLKNGSSEFTIQHRMLCKDNLYLWMSCRGVITRNKDGKAIRIAGFHSDAIGGKVADDLTGLPNRALLLDHLSRSIETARKNSGHLFAVFILELDLPEYTVNRFGPTDRDLLLIAVARRLETCLRTSDTISQPRSDHVVARSKGGQFIVLIDGLNEVSESKIIAERLLKEISPPFEVRCREVFLSANIGIALSATGYQDAQEVLRDADIALYRAKSMGKGRSEVFDTAILESVKARLELESDLQQALERQEFSVFYQPIVSLSSYKIAGFEALLRWKHPVRGAISPAEFIPVAESTGLIIPLGHWIIREVCRQLKVWKENPDVRDDLYVSVNLSSVQFKNPLFLKDICKVLLEVGHDANSLILELTEGGVMENPETASRVLMQLRVTGARIAIDDFGTGYSSLSYLCRFPLDYLKIDQSFVKNIETSKDAQAIVRTISSLAHQLGLRVIAEGIERQGQLDLIRSLDCEYGQGFLFSKAVVKEKVESLLKKDFLPLVSEAGPAAIPDGGDMQYVPPILNPSTLPVEDPASDQQKIITKPGKFRINAGVILTASAAIILLLTTGLLDSVKTADPVSHAEEIQKQSVEEVALKPSPETPKTARVKKAATFREFPVVHDHFMGSCTGTLKIADDTIAYLSENEGCSFESGYDEMEYLLDKDRLEIRIESKNYHFKSAGFSTKEENLSQLQEIYAHISKSRSRN